MNRIERKDVTVMTLNRLFSCEVQAHMYRLIAIYKRQESPDCEDKTVIQLRTMRINKSLNNDVLVSVQPMMFEQRPEIHRLIAIYIY